MKEELEKEIDKAMELLKGCQVKHLFSEDASEKGLAELRMAVGRIHTLLKCNKLKDLAHPKTKPISCISSRMGSLVKVRPCGEEYGNKTYLGFYIGDIATGSSISYEGDKIHLEFSDHNPGIFVPELKKIIYGFESWWGEIEDEKELSDITDDDIQNVWYVKLLKQMQGGKSETTAE